MLRAVDMAFEGHAPFRQLAQARKAHDLKAAAVGQDRLLPVHEIMQPAKRGDPFGGGAQHQVIGIAQQDIRPGFRDAFGQHGLYGGSGAHGHEGGGADIAPRGVNDARAGLAVPRGQIEAGACHWVSFHGGDGLRAALGTCNRARPGPPCR